MSELFDALAPGYDDDACHPLVAETLVNGLAPEPKAWPKTCAICSTIGCPKR